MEEDEEADEADDDEGTVCADAIVVLIVSVTRISVNSHTDERTDSMDLKLCGDLSTGVCVCVAVCWGDVGVRNRGGGGTTSKMAKAFGPKSLISSW